MKNIIAAIIIATGLNIAPIAQAETIELEKRDYLKLIVGNYVHGFKEFDTSVVAFDDSVSVGIYFDSDEQDKSRADQLAERFRKQLPLMLERYEWADEIAVVVSVYSESRAERGYR